MTPSNESLVSELNKALALEMRAEVMYAHYAVYVKGINRLHLKPSPVRLPSLSLTRKVFVMLLTNSAAKPLLSVTIRLFCIRLTIGSC